MDAVLRNSMLRYYDERASEYEDAYVLGTGTSSISDPTVFQREAALLGDIVERFAHGRLIDLACGTGYWLPRYAARCSNVTLVDQSARMLDECAKKIVSLELAGRCTMIRADVLDHSFEREAYDCALVGFLMSHLTSDQESSWFDTLRRMMTPSGRFLILDSAWTPERERFNAKIERQERRLNDGTRFEIYKRYVSRDDIAAWAAAHDMTLTIEHCGAAFVAVSGCFTYSASYREGRRATARQP